MSVLGRTEFTGIFASYRIAVTVQVNSRFITASAPYSRSRRAMVCHHGGHWSRSRLRRCDSRLERDVCHLTKKRKSSRDSQRACQTTCEGRVDYFDRCFTTQAIYPIFSLRTEAEADQKQDNGC